MLATRGFTHIQDGEYALAAQWCERAARSPGAHVLIAMVAAVAQWLAGNEAAARTWAANVRQRNPRLSERDFLASFPLRSEAMRSQVSGALRKLGF
jgi:hypothetical protein